MWQTMTRNAFAPDNRHHLRERLQPFIAELRALAKLGAPLAATQLAQMGIITTDVLMVGALSSDALAAVTLGSTLYYFGWVMGFGPMAAVAPVVAHALGRDPGDEVTPRLAVRMSLWAAILLSIPLGTLMLFVQPIYLALGQPPALAAAVEPYVLALIPGLVFSLAFGGLRVFMSAVHAPRAPLIVLLLTIGANVFFNYALIFGHFGLPRLELLGAGLATTLANLFSFLALLGWIMIAPKLKRFRVMKALHRPHWPTFTELFRLGLPIGMTMLFEGTLFQAGVLIMGTFGAGVLAAHQVALNVASITFMLPLGLAMAGTVRVGLNAGAGDAKGARLAGLTAMGAGAGVSFFCAALMMAFPREIAGLYLDASLPENAEVIALAAHYLGFAAMFQLFDAVQVTANLALRGLKDTRVPMILAGLAYWAIGFPIALGLALWGGINGDGVWLGFVGGLGAAAIALALRFHWLTRTAGH